MLRSQSSSVFERGCGGNARVGDDNVQAAKHEDRLVKRGVDLTLVGHTDVHSADYILAELLAKVGDGRVQAFGVDVREHDAGAFAHQPRRDRSPDAACASRHQRDASSERFWLGHALELGLFQKPIFDVERFLLR